MTEKKTAIRLGKILLDKGLITAAQLETAVIEQARRRQVIPTGDDKSTLQATALGEILIELGYINRLQLNRSLSWQSMLRKFGMVMAFCAPLMSFGTGAVAAVGDPNKSLPLTVQAEEYTAMSGIKTQATTDVGGGLNVGYIDAGDWMSYSGTSVFIPVSGTYKVTFRVASSGGGGSFSFSESASGAIYDTITVPSTGGSQNWVNVERTITIPAGTHSFQINALIRGTGFNINWFKIETIGTPLPLTIQAESFASMSGIQTQATTDVGGGLNVGYIDSGDWLSYSNTSITIANSGNYKITYRVASTSGGGSFTLNEASSGVSYDTVIVPATGGSQTWVDVERTITLTAGVHSFKIMALTRGSGFNINWFKIDNISDPSAPAAVSSSSSSVTTSASLSSSPTVSLSSSSSSSSLSSTSPSSTGGAVLVTGPVALRWMAPSQRENLTTLDITELAGYELRYKLATDIDFSYISISDPWVNSYNFAWLDGNYIFQIAAIDKNGLYSNFMTLTPH